MVHQDTIGDSVIALEARALEVCSLIRGPSHVLFWSPANHEEDREARDEEDEEALDLVVALEPNHLLALFLSVFQIEILRLAERAERARERGGEVGGESVGCIGRRGGNVGEV